MASRNLMLPDEREKISETFRREDEEWMEIESRKQSERNKYNET